MVTAALPERKASAASAGGSPRSRSRSMQSVELPGQPEEAPAGAEDAGAGGAQSEAAAM